MGAQRGSADERRASVLRAVEPNSGGIRVDAFVEGLCSSFYAEPLGRPSLQPGGYFRLLFIGFFEGVSPERGIAWRVADSLSLRSFLERHCLGVLLNSRRSRLARSLRYKPGGVGLRTSYPSARRNRLRRRSGARVPGVSGRRRSTDRRAAAASGCRARSVARQRRESENDQTAAARTKCGVPVGRVTAAGQRRGDSSREKTALSLSLRPGRPLPRRSEVSGGVLVSVSPRDSGPNRSRSRSGTHRAGC